MNDDALTDLAEELVSRPFPDSPTGGNDWLVGLAQSGPEAHFAPIAMSESLYETPADHDGSIAERYDEVYHDFERRRLGPAAGVLVPGGAQAGDGKTTTAWRCSTMTSPLFTGGRQFPAWRRDDRIVGLLLGQMDKEFPIVLTLALIARPTPAV